MTAALVRHSGKRFPSLRTLLREPAPRVEGRQSPDAQRAFFLDFARRAGLRVERHEKPVLEYPVN